MKKVGETWEKAVLALEVKKLELEIKKLEAGEKEDKRTCWFVCVVLCFFVAWIASGVYCISSLK